MQFRQPSPFFAAGPPNCMQFYPCFTASPVPVCPSQNAPIYNGPFQDVIGEGEVSSVVLPDGTVQLYFLPTTSAPKCGYCMHNPNRCWNQNNNSGAWFIRTVNSPNNIRMPQSLPFPSQIFGGASCNRDDHNLHMALPPCPGFQTNQGVKFHNDRCTSTEDIRYFCPVEGQRCDTQTPPSRCAAAVQVSIDTPCCVGTVCKSPCKCCHNCANEKSAEPPIYEGCLGHFDSDMSIDETRRGEKRRKKNGDCNCVNVCSTCSLCDKNRKRSKKQRYSDSCSSSSSSRERREARKRQVKARRMCEKHRKMQQRERNKRENERKKREKECEKEKRRREKEESKIRKCDQNIQTCGRPTFCDISASDMPTCAKPIKQMQINEPLKQDLQKDTSNSPYSCDSSPPISSRLASAFSYLTSSIASATSCRSANGECPKAQQELHCVAGPKLSNKELIRREKEAFKRLQAAQNNWKCDCNTKCRAEQKKSDREIQRRIKSELKLREKEFKKCELEQKKCERENKNEEKLIQKENKKIELEEKRSEKELQRKMKAAKKLAERKLKKCELEQKRSQKNLQREQRKLECQQRREEIKAERRHRATCGKDDTPECKIIDNLRSKHDCCPDSMQTDQDQCGCSRSSRLNSICCDSIEQNNTLLEPRRIAKPCCCSRDEPTLSTSPTSPNQLKFDCYESAMSIDGKSSSGESKITCKIGPVKIIDISGDSCRDCGTHYNGPQTCSRRSSTDFNSPQTCSKRSSTDLNSPQTCSKRSSTSMQQMKSTGIGDSKSSQRDCGIFCEGPTTENKQITTHTHQASSGIFADILKMFGIGVQCSPTCPAASTDTAPSPSAPFSAACSQPSFVVDIDNSNDSCTQRNHSCNPL